MILWVTLFLHGIVCAEAVNGLLGGLVDVDRNRVGDALNYAIMYHNRESNDTNISSMAELVSAKKQVVSGIVFHFTVKMAKTSCRKRISNEQCDAQDPAEAQTYECKFKVWEHPWINREPEVQQVCENH
ncbi:cystatin-C-like [Corythoichthys intestinalis]|uniref:cystatin-C-like n=1 Tax=Corythoichthys intestinalis TaxID=161448 RepID=UPI0025A5FCF9|nr:cystatin-C-like [Corythoichthys intestinalis]